MLREIPSPLSAQGQLESCAHCYCWHGDPRRRRVHLQFGKKNRCNISIVYSICLLYIYCKVFYIYIYIYTFYNILYYYYIYINIYKKSDPLYCNIPRLGLLLLHHYFGGFRKPPVLLALVQCLWFIFPVLLNNLMAPFFLLVLPSSLLSFKFSFLFVHFPCTCEITCI